jgi:DNA-binding PadR family transcriptional regulator
MSLQQAVLALVLERRGYGYDLAQRLEQRVGPAWRLNPSAVYPALDQLERAGLVTGAARPRGTHRSPRVVYSATPAGAAARDAWLAATGTPPEPVRSELHLRLAFAREADRAPLLAELAAHEQACEALLTRYAERASAASASTLIDAAVVGRLRAELEAIRAASAAIVGHSMP